MDEVYILLAWLRFSIKAPQFIKSVKYYKSIYTAYIFILFFSFKPHMKLITILIEAIEIYLDFGLDTWVEYQKDHMVDIQTLLKSYKSKLYIT